MLYLMFCKDGFMRKFPLNRPVVSIGRGGGNDLVLDDPSISRRHCRVNVAGEHLEIADLRSHNGVFVGAERVREARIVLNQSFGAGDVEIYFKRGEIREFEVSPELSALFSSTQKSRRGTGSEEKTGHSASKYQGALASAAEKALRVDDPVSFREELRADLALLELPGCLIFQEGNGAEALYDSLPAPHDLRGAELARLAPGEAGTARMDGTAVIYQSYRSAAGGPEFRLLHLAAAASGQANPALESFFRTLAEIIASQRRLAPGDPPARIQDHSLYAGPSFQLIGQSPAMKQIAAVVRKIAPKDSFVLILGENGTGKELLARMIHELSGRGPYVALNCAAIPSSLLESELFGAEAGAFTDACKRTVGKIELSSGGTLVLDEIGDMPLELQAKLLRAIQERAVTRLGGNELTRVDLRIVSLTNRDIYRLAGEGRFREDLFFRLRVHELTIPPLRERPEDIQALILHFTQVYARKNGILPGGFSRAAHDCLLNYPWPGNARELENEVARIMEIIDDGELVGTHHILPAIVRRWEEQPRAGRGLDGATLREKRDDVERQEIAALLEEHGGNKMQASRLLGMSYRGFLKKLKRLGM